MYVKNESELDTAVGVADSLRSLAANVKFTEGMVTQPVVGVNGENVEPDSLAAQEFQKFDDNVKQILADMFVDMSMDAGEKLSTIKAAGMTEKITTGVGGDQIAKLDADYLDAVNRGDTEAAQQMVDQAASEAGAIHDENGEPLKLYRGTYGGQTTFAKDDTYNGKIYTIDNIDVATKYGDKSGKATDIQHQTKGEKTTYALYGFSQKTLTIDAKYGVWSDLAIPEELLEYADGRYKATNAEIAEWAEQAGYDALRIDNVRDGSFDEGSEIIFFNENAVKSADPVTYDDKGNVIPLSERFDSGKKDIRYKLPHNGNKNTTDEGGVKMQLREVHGSSIVWVPNGTFAKSQLMDPKEIASYIASRIGDVYKIIESGQRVYIGPDLPNEYTHSRYTSHLQRNDKSTLKAKNKATPGIGKMIEIATNRRWEKTKHNQNKDAKYGMYRYDTYFAFPVKDRGGNITSVKAFSAELLIRNASDGKKYLYDIVNIKEDTAKALDLQKREVRKGSKSAAARSNVSANSIRNSDPNVNKNSEAKEKGPFKLPAGKDAADRGMLVDLFEQMVTGSDEYRALQNYKKNIDQMLALEEKVDRLTEEIKRVSFAEGPKNMEYLDNLKAQRKQAVAELNRFDNILLGLEKSGVLRAMIERNRKTIQQETRDKVREYYRQKNETREAEIRQYYRESRRKAVERHEQAEVRQRIRKDVQKLDSLLNKGTKEKNVKLELKEFAGAALRTAKESTGQTTGVFVM